MDHDQEQELNALEGILSDPSGEPIKLSYGILKFITDNFSYEIGRGGFGVVYQGSLQNEVVAVKRSRFNVTDKQFMDEIKCLKRANHKNIVRFLGYCADTQGEVMPLDGTFVMAAERNRLLCFEFVPNGNIRQYLEQENSHIDDWPTRYQMIRGICQGLNYLHDKQINHLDLKPENVMLDAHMEAKITDFGLSRFLDHGQSRIITKHICGTLRYIAPEVIDKSELSFKSDIYALGIIIIELLTGTSMISLANWDESLHLMDCPRARMCVEIARNCTDVERDNRPTIHDIIHCMDELESKVPKYCTTSQLVTATAFSETELLDVYPLELRFLFKPDEAEMSCRLIMTNKTDACVYCIVSLKNFKFFLPPMSSSVATVHIEAAEEIPSDMLKCEVVMFTTSLYDSVEELRRVMSLFPPEEYATREDAFKDFQFLLGGELYRAALTASVTVGSNDTLNFDTLSEDQGYITRKPVDVHPTEPWVLITAHDMVYIWNWRTGEELGKLDCSIWSLDGSLMAKFIAQEQWVVVGKRNGSILVHTCPTMDKVKEFEAHGCGFTSLAVHPTRPFLLSFSLPLTLKLWDWSRDWTCIRIFSVTSPLRQVMFNPKDTTTFATCGEYGFVQMWTIGRPNPITTTHRENGRGGIRVFTYTGQKDFAAVIDDGEGISIWDLRKEKHVYTLHTGESSNVALVCHPTRPILVTISEHGRIQLWDSTTYRLKMTHDNLGDGIIHVGFTAPRWLVIGYRQRVSVFDIDLE